MENEEKITLPAPKTLPLGDEVKTFYSKDLVAIIVKVFGSPIRGTRSLFTEQSEKSFIQSLILVASVAVVSAVFVLLIIPSEIREYVSWITIAGKAVSFAVLYLLLVSGFSFGLKMLSGKAEFRSELFTGAVCGIPFVASVALIFLFSKVMMNDQILSDIMMRGYGSLISRGGILLLFLLYTHLLSFNILFQSQRASGTKDVAAWYLSPLGILLAYYITFKIIF